ncbi:putative leader peptide [Streptomyces sp. NPDC127098]
MRTFAQLSQRRAIDLMRVATAMCR